MGELVTHVLVQDKPYPPVPGRQGLGPVALARTRTHRQNGERPMTHLLNRLAYRSEVTLREALIIGGLGVVYVAMAFAGGLLLAVYG
jgi:hypothetical protein